jgi:transcriptional regulator with XRE-family HTH domain
MLDLDETTLSRIVNGFRQPCPEVKIKIAVALNSNLEWLFEETVDMNGAARRQGPRVGPEIPVKDESS